MPIVVWVKTQAGPGAWWDVFAASGRASAPIFSLDFTQRVNVVGIILLNFLWNVCTHGADQVAAQRYLSTNSAKTARRSLWIFGVADVGMVLLLMTCGLALFYFDFGQQGLSLEAYSKAIPKTADKVFPRFILEVMPAGLSGLLLAALLAAAMSSLSSGINSITTVIVTDGVERLGLSLIHI